MQVTKQIAETINIINGLITGVTSALEDTNKSREQIGGLEG